MITLRLVIACWHYLSRLGLSEVAGLRSLFRLSPRSPIPNLKTYLLDLGSVCLQNDCSSVYSDLTENDFVAGSYAAGGGTTCDACDGGSYDDDSDSATACVTCDAGSYAAGGGTRCDACDGGSLDDEFGRAPD